MAQLISDLKALKEAAAQGLITEDEYSRERALIMVGPRSTPTPDGATANMVSAVQALTAVATALTQNAAQRVPRNVDQVRSPSPSRCSWCLSIHPCLCSRMVFVRVELHLAELFLAACLFSFFRLRSD